MNDMKLVKYFENLNESTKTVKKKSGTEANPEANPEANTETNPEAAAQGNTEADGKVKEAIGSTKSMPFKESATLNQILYVNEKYNKRELPRNEDKKNLHEILKNDAIPLADFQKEVEIELNNIDKEWKHISMLKKRQLLESYCRDHDIHLTDPVRKTILQNAKHVMYSREQREIVDISIPI